MTGMTGRKQTFRTALLVCLLAALVSLPLGTGCSDCDLKIETNELRVAFVGEPYVESLNSDCGGDSWFLEAGNLPPGIELREDGDLRGTPTRAGVYDFTVGVADIDGFDIELFNDIAFKGLSLIVEEP